MKYYRKSDVVEVVCEMCGELLVRTDTGDELWPPKVFYKLYAPVKGSHNENR